MLEESMHVTIFNNLIGSAMSHGPNLLGIGNLKLVNC